MDKCYCFKSLNGIFTNSNYYEFCYSDSLPDTVYVLKNGESDLRNGVLLLGYNSFMFYLHHFNEHFIPINQLRDNSINEILDE